MVLLEFKEKQNNNESINKCNTCDDCFLWKKRFNSLHKKYIKIKHVEKINNSFNNDDLNLELIFNNNNFIEKDVIRDYPLKNFKKNYYEYYLKQYPINTKNRDNVNNSYKNVNNHMDNKLFINIKIIYEWHNLYKCYLDELKLDKTLSFDDYVNYNKKRFKYIEKICRFKNKVHRCYIFVEEIKKHIQEIENIDLLDILKKCNITYTKLYKLKHQDMEGLIKFIFDKYNIYTTDISRKIKNIKTISGISITETSKKYENKSVLTYPGNKKNVLQKYGDTFNIKNNEYFIDVFCGSLSSSLYARNINPNINIIAFDSNHYLINFYEILRDKYDELINKIKHIILIINKKQSIDDKMKYIRNSLILFINNFSKYNDEYTRQYCAAIYYELTKLCFYIKYTKNGDLRVDIDKRKLEKPLYLDEDKLLQFSNFLKTIILIKHDYKNDGYDIIHNFIKNKDKVFVYFDPPYDIYDKEYCNYGTPFDKKNHEELLVFVNSLTSYNINCIISNSNTEFVKNLYNKYIIKEIKINCNINNNDIREELLIYNYNPIF